jgi:hypothetical protein
MDTPTPTPRPATIIAVTSEDDRHAKVRQRAATLARTAGSIVILWDRDADVSPLESSLPTEWSGDGEQEQFGDRLAPNDLEAAGRAPLARQVGELRDAGVDAWGWLPDTADASHLADYAADQGADLVLVSASDDDLIADLRDMAERGSDRDREGTRGPRIEAVPA